MNKESRRPTDASGPPGGSSRLARAIRWPLLAAALFLLPWTSLSCAWVRGRKGVAGEFPPEPFTGDPDYDRARSLVAGGQGDQARKLLLEEEEPRLPELTGWESDRLLFLLGILSLRYAGPEEALARFAKVSAVYDLLGDYLLWHEAQALVELGRLEDARGKLDTLISTFPDSIWADDAAFEIFGLDAGLKTPVEAAQRAKDLIAGNFFSTPAFQKDPGLALSQFAQVFEAAGDKTGALALWERLYSDHPAAPDAENAPSHISALRLELNLPVWIPTPEQVLQRVAGLFRTGRTEDTWQEISGLLDRLRPAREGAAKGDYTQALFWKGKLLEARGQQEKARGLYLGAIRNGFDADGGFRIRLGRIASRRSNRAAVEQYLLAAKEHPGSPLAPQALYQAARLAQIAKDARLADALFNRMRDEYPDFDRIPLVLFNQGWIAFRQAHYEDAARTFDQLARQYAASDQYERALYWGGRARELLSGAEAALPYYAKLVEQRPAGYYGLLARNLLLGNSAHDPPPAVLDAEELADLGLPEPTHEELSENRLAVQVREFAGESRKAVERAGELIALGLLPEARAELERAVSANEEVSGNLALLRPLLDRARAWRLSQRVAYRLNGAQPLALDEGTLPLWKTFYPLGFALYVNEHARRQGVDPRLVLSVMREESLFDPQARSWADARGLMQIIPPTGEKIARAQDFSDFSPERLYDPETSIRFGAYYLSELLRQFGGNPVFAIASYNGGPHNVKKWRSEFGNVDMDVFVEEIPFQETRDYVKKVYRSWSLYRILYSPDGLAALSIPAAPLPPNGTAVPNEAAGETPAAAPGTRAAADLPSGPAPRQAAIEEPLVPADDVVPPDAGEPDAGEPAAPLAASEPRPTEASLEPGIETNGAPPAQAPEEISNPAP